MVRIPDDQLEPYVSELPGLSPRARIGVVWFGCMDDKWGRRRNCRYAQAVQQVWQLSESGTRGHYILLGLPVSREREKHLRIVHSDAHVTTDTSVTPRIYSINSISPAWADARPTVAPIVLASESTSFPSQDLSGYLFLQRPMRIIRIISARKFS